MCQSCPLFSLILFPELPLESCWVPRSLLPTWALFPKFPTLSSLLVSVGGFPGSTLKVPIWSSAPFNLLASNDFLTYKQSVLIFINLSGFYGWKLFTLRTVMWTLFPLFELFLFHLDKLFCSSLSSHAFSDGFYQIAAKSCWSIPLFECMV